MAGLLDFPMRRTSKQEMDEAAAARARMEQAAIAAAARRKMARQMSSVPEAPDLPIPDFRGPPSAVPNPRTAGDADMAGYGGSPRLLDPQADQPDQPDNQPRIPQGDGGLLGARPAAAAPAGGLLAPEDKDAAALRDINMRAGFGGLMSLGAGLMGYGADTRNAAPLMAGVQGFQQALQGAMADRYRLEQAKQMQAHSDLYKAQAAKMAAEEQRSQQFVANLTRGGGAGAGGPQVAQGDNPAAIPMADFTDTERQAILSMPTLKDQSDLAKQIMSKKIIDRLPQPGFRNNPDGSQTFIKGSQADPQYQMEMAKAKREAELKPIPTPVTSGLRENMATLNEIDRAIEALKANPDAVGGIWNNVTSVLGPAGAIQRNYGTEGTNRTQALVTGVGGQKLHDMSGAAVTVQEDARLAPYIPKVSDSQETALIKLNTLRQRYQDQIRLTTDYYNSPGSGFRPFEFKQEPQQQAPTQGGGPAPGQVIDGYRFKGGNPADKNNWERAQ